MTSALLKGTGQTASLTAPDGVPDENLRTMARFGRSACMGAPITYRDVFTDADVALARDLAQQIAFGAVRAEARGEVS